MAAKWFNSLETNSRKQPLKELNWFVLIFSACSSELQSQRSQPLKKKINKKNAKQRIVPLDPLSEVPQPKGFPDGPPPRPSDPIDNLNLEGTGTIFMIRDSYKLVSSLVPVKWQFGWTTLCGYVSWKFSFVHQNNFQFTPLWLQL